MNQAKTPFYLTTEEGDGVLLMLNELANVFPVKLTRSVEEFDNKKEGGIVLKLTGELPPDAKIELESGAYDVQGLKHCNGTRCQLIPFRSDDSGFEGTFYLRQFQDGRLTFLVKSEPDTFSSCPGCGEWVPNEDIVKDDSGRDEVCSECYYEPVDRTY